ncbi:hypothetical protein GGS21DRAFT_326889 [Xylaria nigripes]|nr:hypothetical protein GGS21DRAFT_326889 [Xylaria nigripes]
MDNNPKSYWCWLCNDAGTLCGGERCPICAMDCDRQPTDIHYMEPLNNMDYGRAAPLESFSMANVFSLALTNTESPKSQYGLGSAGMHPAGLGGDLISGDAAASEPETLSGAYVSPTVSIKTDSPESQATLPKPQGRFICPDCENTYAHRKDVIRHRRMNHEQTDPYICRCSYSCTRKDNFKRHLIEYCKDQFHFQHYQCQCGFHTENKDDFINHLRQCGSQRVRRRQRHY